ncbi:GYF_domain [Hexamita inflata]|uniref:GYF domain n=1 Tax=Hexamita inflata TaxID=28002 RepID=A0AA86UHQ2_9EUKA|nr:GYF domain [Hexamita inflata]
MNQNETKLNQNTAQSDPQNAPKNPLNIQAAALNDQSNSESEILIENSDEIYDEETSEEETNTIANTDQYFEEQNFGSQMYSTRNVPKSKLKQFEDGLLQAFKQQFNIEFKTIKEAFAHYKQQKLVSSSKTKLNLKLLAAQCDLTDEICRNLFMNTESLHFDKWDSKTKQEVAEKLTELWKTEQNKIIVKQKVLNEFKIKEQINKNYREMKNFIHYKLLLLERAQEAKKETKAIDNDTQNVQDQTQKNKEENKEKNQEPKDQQINNVKQKYTVQNKQNEQINRSTSKQNQEGQDQIQNNTKNNKKDQLKAQNKQNADQKDKSQNQQSNPETNDDLNTKENDSEPETDVIKRNKDQIIEAANQLLESAPKQSIESIPEKPEGSDSWRYIDLNGQIQGPFSAKQMNKWNYKGKLPVNLLVSSGNYSYKLQAKDQQQTNFFRETEKGSKKVLTDFSKVDRKHEGINIDDILRQEQQIQAIATGTTNKTKQNVTKKTPQQQNLAQQTIQTNQNQTDKNENELNPEAENNKTNKPKQNKQFMGYDYDNFDGLDLIQPMEEVPQINEQTEYAESQPMDNEAISYISHHDLSINQSNSIAPTNSVPTSTRQVYSTQEIFNVSTERNTDMSFNLSAIVSQGQQKLFEQCVLDAINIHFGQTENIMFSDLKAAVKHYRSRITGKDTGKTTKIQLDFKEIANKCGMDVKLCNQNFQTLLANNLESWDEQTKQNLINRIRELWHQDTTSSIEDKKKAIKQAIKNEFSFKEKAEFDYKQITNVINYQLTSLAKKQK